MSNVIDLGVPASLGSLTWAGQQDEGATLALSTRSGHDDDPNTYWRYTFRGGERTRFDEKGRPLTLASYNKLARGAQAGFTHDTAGWTFWSAAQDFVAGEGVITGAGPRQYVQVARRLHLGAECQRSARLGGTGGVDPTGGATSYRRDHALGGAAGGRRRVHLQN